MKKFFSFLAACLLSMSAAWAQYTFTVFNTNTGTLTYYCDTYANMQKMGGEEYDSQKDRFKNYAQDVWTVVIDESMKDAPFRRLNKMFYGGLGNELSNVTEIIGLENLNTEKVTDMTDMFYGCKSLQSIDVSKLNTGNVEIMNGMFELCASLKTLDLSNFSTSNVRDMSLMFDGCKALQSVDLSSFNTQNVNDMNGMFYDCENLTVLNIAHFDMQSVTSVSSMFGGCKKLKTIYCNDDWNKIGMDADETFEECYSLVGGNGTRFDPDHTYIDYARPDKPGEPGYFTTYDPVPTDDRTIISECAFEGFDVSSLYAGLEWNNDAFEEIFNKIQKEDGYAPYHLEAPFRLFKDEISDETEVPCDQGNILEEGLYLFYGRISIDEDYATQFRFPTSEEADLKFTMDGTSWIVDNVFVEEDESVAFIISPSFQVAPQKPEAYAAFDELTGTLTYYYDMNRAEYDATVLLPWKDEVFYNAYKDDIRRLLVDPSFQNAPLESSWGLFHYASAQTQIMPSVEKIDGLEYINTETMTDLSNLFARLTSIEELNLTVMDLSHVTITKGMFWGCNKLKKIICDEDLSNVANSKSMFLWCESLVGGNGTACDGENNVDAEYARPDEEGKPGYFTSVKTGLDEISQQPRAKSQKLIRNGQLLILRGDKTYTITGVEVK